MEAELQSAVSEYRSQLAALEQLLREEPGNQEVREVYEQLQGALQYTLAALGQVDEQQQAAAGDQADVTGGEVRGQGDAPPAAGSAATDAADVTTLGNTAAAAATATDAPSADDAAAAACCPLPRPRGGAPNNARMHPANRYYRAEPDFGALADRYEELRPFVSRDAAGRAHLCTTSWAASRALTACLLRQDFGVAWGLPEGQLVPPLTNRANYLHWMHDLLHLSAPQADGPLRGLDIGCGANFIYCLLGAALFGWSMVGVDVTQVAVRCCRQLIADNPQLAPLLEVRDLSHLHPEKQGPAATSPAAAVEPAQGAGRRGRKRPALDRPGPGTTAVQQPNAEEGGGGEGEGESSAGRERVEGEGHAGVVGDEGDGSADGNEQGILLPAILDEETFAFSMCNPPFFESMQEAAQNPNTAFGGTAAEMVCPGGELAFVLRMLAESEALRDRVHWFSTMVGKKSTLKALRRELHCRHVTALRTTELAQGKTSRWAVAWSWQVDPNKASQPLRRTGEAAAATAAAPGGGGSGGDQELGGEAVGLAGGSRQAAEGLAPARQAAQRQQHQQQAGRGAPSLAAAGVAVLPRRHISFTVQQAGSHAGGRPLLQRVQQGLQERGCSGVQVDAAGWTVTWPLQGGPFSAGEGPRGAAAGAKRPREEAAGGSGSWASNITARLRIAQQQRGRMEVVATIPNSAPDAAARAFAALMSSLERSLVAAAN